MKHTPSFQDLRRRRRWAGFTLIEMLVVIGIIGILTALGGVALRGLNGSTSRRTAVNTLMGVFDQARMVAISDGRPTYVVFVSAPKGQSDLAATQLPDSMWGRAYTLFEDSDSASATPFTPVQRSAWLYLPTGVAFKSDNGSDDTHASVTATTRAQRDPADLTKFNIQSRAGSGTTLSLMLPYVKFDAQGQIVDYNGDIVTATSSCLRLLLFEGSTTNSGDEIQTHRVSAQNTSDGKKSALDEILLKPTTGRAEYTLNPVNNLAVTTSKTP